MLKKRTCLRVSQLYLIPLFSGALLTFSFAPFNYYFLAIIAPALLLATWLTLSPKQTWLSGFLFGLGFFGTGISWVFISIHTYGNTNALLAGILTASFVMLLALFPAFFGYLFTRFFPKNNITKLLFAFPSLWVLSEWLRSWLFTGFPWLLIGNSQTNSPLAGYAALTSVFGVSFLTVLSSALLLQLFRTGKNGYKYALLFIVIWLTGYGLLQVHWTHPTGQPEKVVLIQGNISQKIKWQANHTADILTTYLQLTEPYWNAASLIVWPEAAIPLLKQTAEPFLQQLDKAAVENNTTLLAGIPTEDSAGQYHNSLISLGTHPAQYDKRHLVPFGEYLPFKNLLSGLINFFNLPMSNFAEGAQHQANFFANHLIISPFICYEIAYPLEVREAVKQANVLLTVSDDSWFGRSLAPAQHLQIGQMRSLETGKPQIFSTNDGLTALIGPKGKIQKMIPAFNAGVLTGTIQAMAGVTPWVWLGPYPLLFILFILLGLAWRFSKE